MEKSLDLRGLICPEPVLRAKKVLDDKNVLKLEAIVESEVNVNNLSRLASSLKMNVRNEQRENYFLVTIERTPEPNGVTDIKSSDTNASTSAAEDLASASANSVGVVVFLGKDTLGEGDADFSKTLMSLFLQTMFEAGHRPRAILMANSGVRLLAKDSSSFKVLQDFRAKGVDVLACGLCVEYYKLGDDIPPDQITNMFSICEYMFAADKLVIP
jgi:selenium metabolism protein YedF